MRRLLALVGFLSGCAVGTRPVVVVSIRGLGHDELQQYEAPPDGFMANATRRPLQPIAVAETAPEMATFETGALPEMLGIEGSYAMEQPFRVEALWEAAARSGLRVVRIGSLFVQGSGPLPSGVRSLPQCEPLSERRLIELTPAATATAPGFERAYRLIETQSSRHRLEALHAYAVDTERDGIDRVAAIVLDDDDDLQNGSLGVAPANSWIAVGLGRRGAARAGAWVKITALSGDGHAMLYVRPTFANRGSPEEFVREVEGKLGFCPGSPDIDAFGAGLIDAATLMEEVARESQYAVNSARLAIAGKADLVMLDIARLDRVGHAFGQDPAASSVRRAAILETDRDLAALAGAIAPHGAILASSGYSFFSSHTKVSIARALQMAKLEVGELKAGTVAAIMRGDPRSSAVLNELVDSRNGAHPFYVEPPSRGFVRVRARPGYTLSAKAEDQLFSPPRFAGEHGYAGSTGVFFYRGPRLVTAGAIRAADVAVTAAAILGIDPPLGSSGCDHLQTPVDEK